MTDRNGVPPFISIYILLYAIFLSFIYYYYCFLKTWLAIWDFLQCWVRSSPQLSMTRLLDVSLFVWRVRCVSLLQVCCQARQQQGVEDRAAEFIKRAVCSCFCSFLRPFAVVVFDVIVRYLLYSLRTTSLRRLFFSLLLFLFWSWQWQMKGRFVMASSLSGLCSDGWEGEDADGCSLPLVSSLLLWSFYSPISLPLFRSTSGAMRKDWLNCSTPSLF